MFHPPTRRSVLLGALRSQRGRIGLGALLFSLHQAGEAMVPVLIGVVVDRAVKNGGAGDLALWIGVLGLVFATLSLSYRFGARRVEAAAEWSAHDLRLQVTGRVLHPGGGAEKGHLPGELASIATSDAQRVGAVSTALVNGTAAVVAMLVGGIALARVSLPLGLLILAGGPALLVLTHLLGRPLESRSEAEQERAARASGIAADLVTGLRVLKGIGAEPAAVTRYRRTSQDSLAATLRAARAQAGYQGAMLALSGLFLALVTLAGARQALNGSITVGQLVSAVGLAQFLLGPLLVFAWVNAEFAQGRASAGRIAAVLATPVAVGPGGNAPAPGVSGAGAIRLKGVDHAGLAGLDLDISAGELLGVVAADPDDAGALLSCLGREADPGGGCVELDGVRLTDLDPDAVRALVLVARHDADLFGGTLLANLGARERTPAVDDAMRASAADDVSDTLESGPDSVLAERGGNLSGGQRQRVALARALCADAPVLALQDPTTAVDTVTEARIAAGLRALRRGRTTIVVTTSPALLAVTDRVVVLADGRVRVSDTHERLIAEDDDYRTVVSV